MTRRTVDGLCAWLVYTAGLILIIVSLYGLVAHGERVAFWAWIGLLAGVGACAYARHLFITMARIDRAQAHIRALLDAHFDRTPLSDDEVAELARRWRQHIGECPQPLNLPRRPLDPRDLELWIRQIQAADTDQIINEASEK